MTDTYVDDWIETNSGIRFQFNNPLPNMITILDISRSLSKQCRYMGHTHTFYSVAEHCCHMYDYAKKHDIENQGLRTVLLHDATESYLVDMARPIKKHLPDYNVMESRLYTAIAKRFNIFDPIPLWVKDIDNRILVDERAQAMRPSSHVWGIDNLVPLGIKIHFWEPSTAEFQFHRRFLECEHD